MGLTASAGNDPLRVYMRPREHSYVRGHYARSDPAAGLSRSDLIGSEVTRAYHGWCSCTRTHLIESVEQAILIFSDAFRTGTRGEFSTEFPTGEQCHVFPKLCLSYDDLLEALASWERWPSAARTERVNKSGASFKKTAIPSQSPAATALPKGEPGGCPPLHSMLK